MSSLLQKKYLSPLLLDITPTYFTRGPSSVSFQVYVYMQDLNHIVMHCKHICFVTTICEVIWFISYKSEMVIIHTKGLYIPALERLPNLFKVSLTQILVLTPIKPLLYSCAYSTDILDKKLSDLQKHYHSSTKIIFCILNKNSNFVINSSYHFPCCNRLDVKLNGFVQLSVKLAKFVFF